MSEIEATPRRQRSPGYPALDLKAAIERTVDVYKVSPRHPVPIDVAAEEWGFSTKSSSGKTVAAALKRFGFVRDVGNGENRQLALTDEGREIAFSTDDRGGRWKELIREAALRPKIHRQVLDQFDGTLPDDRVAVRFLLFDFGFNDEATAKDFLTKLRSTLDFADVNGVDPATASRPTDAADDADDAAPTMHHLPAEAAHDSESAVWFAPPSGPAHRHRRVEPPEPSIYDQFRADRKAVQIPYSHGEWATLQASFPLTEPQWDALIAMLQAMKPGLVQSGGAATTADPGDSDY